MTGGGNQRQRILLVEDDLHLRNCFENLLEYDGHEVHSVDGGEAALVKLEQEKFDLVLTDYLMPQMNGDELARLIKQRRPNLPVILASGSFQGTSTFQSSTPGVDCLLNKPFSLAELREAIIWAIDLHADSGLTGPACLGLPSEDSEALKPSGHPPIGGNHFQ
ncbi:MAG: response regulator [Verrucomicrobiota bacterium]|jgi:CheY-like chemotaxis protein